MLTLALPLVGANLLQMAIYAVDVMFVARLGTIDFAAATLGIFLVSIVMWSMMGLTGACAPIIAAELGRKRHSVREVRRSFRMAFWLAMFVSVPFMLLLFIWRNDPADGQTKSASLGKGWQFSEHRDLFPAASIAAGFFVMYSPPWDGRPGHCGLQACHFWLALFRTGCWCSVMGVPRIRA